MPSWDHSPGCWQPSRTSLSRTTTRTDVRFSVLTVIPQRITAGTLPTTRLPQRRPKRHAISQRDITRLTSTVDYDGSLKNDHYWPNLQGAGQSSCLKTCILHHGLMILTPVLRYQPKYFESILPVDRKVNKNKNSAFHLRRKCCVMFQSAMQILLNFQTGGQDLVGQMKTLPIP